MKESRKKIVAYSRKTEKKVEVEMRPQNAKKEILESVGMSNGGQGCDE